MAGMTALLAAQPYLVELRDAGPVTLPGKDEDILLFETAEDWRCATTSS